MVWPFNRKAESRAAYDEAVIQHILSTVEGSGANLSPVHTAAGQTAAGLIGRSMAIASVEPEEFSRALNARVLHEVGSSLVLEGESVWLIQIIRGEVVLTRASDWDVRDASSHGWRYKLTIPGPDTMRMLDVSSAQVFHPRVNVSKNNPARGRSALNLAAHTGSLLAAIESSLTNEAKSPNGWVLPHPETLKEGDLNDLKKDLKGLAGRTALVPSMSQNWGEGRAGSPSDWTPKRIGANPPDVMVKLRKETHEALLGAAGVPVALFSGSTAQSVREAFRQFLHATLQPLAALVQFEAQEKLSGDLTFDFSRLMAADIQGKARSAKALVDAGFSLEQSAAMSGFLEIGD